MLRFALGLLVLAAACSSDTSDGPRTESSFDQDFVSIVRMRASIEFPCPADGLDVEVLGGLAYLATGCDDDATYECGFDENYGLEWCRRAVHDGPSHVDAGVEDGPSRIDAGVEDGLSRTDAGM